MSRARNDPPPTVRAFMQGWGWGVVCGVVLGTSVVALALVIGRHLG